MRLGSNYSGTQEELEKAMKNNLKLFVSDHTWLDTVAKEVTVQEFIDICESIAECVDKGYLNHTKYNVLADKTIRFHSNFSDITYRNNGDEEAFSLTDEGKTFLRD